MTSRKVDAIMTIVMMHVDFARRSSGKQSAYSWKMAEAWLRRAEQVILSGEG